MPTLGSLTALRFFAALAIVVHHSVAILLPAGTLAAFPLDAGVSFFFVLSGFILTYVHEAGMAGMPLRPFYRARVARIWPMTVVATVLVVLLLPTSMYLPFMGAGWHGWKVAATAAASGVLAHGWIPIPAVYFSFNAPSWSVSTEMFFYLSFPFLLRGFRRHWHWKLALAFAVGMALVLWAEGSGLPHYSVEHLDDVTLHGVSYINPVARLKEFVIGMVACLGFLRFRHRMMRGLAPWTAVEVAAIVALPFAVTHVGELRAHLLTTASLAPAMFVDQALMGLYFAVVVLVFAMGRGVLSALLSSRPLVLLGEISFSLYLLHQIVINVYQTHPQAFRWIPTPLFFSVFLFIMLGLSYFTWRWVEGPTRRYIRNGRASRRQPY